MSTMIVLAKAPVPGRVKTRLCPPCTPAEAALVAEAALRDTLDVAIAARPDRLVVVLDGDRPLWFPNELEVIAQRAGGLGARLADAFADCLGDTREPTMLVAMDTPHVDPTWLRGGFTALQSGADAVLGMTDDGGYWVVGLHEARNAVFDGVPMSEAITGVAQRARLESLGLRVAVLPQTFDIDTRAELDRVVEEHPDLRTSNVWRALRSVSDSAP